MIFALRFIIVIQWQAGKKVVLRRIMSSLGMLFLREPALAPFTSEDITLLMNHINSVKREIFGGKSPYELLKEEIKRGDTDMQKLMEVMYMKEIPPDEIILTLKLFK